MSHCHPMKCLYPRCWFMRLFCFGIPKAFFSVHFRRSFYWTNKFDLQRQAYNTSLLTSRRCLGQCYTRGKIGDVDWPELFQSFCRCRFCFYDGKKRCFVLCSYVYELNDDTCVWMAICQRNDRIKFNRLISTFCNVRHF